MGDLVITARRPQFLSLVTALALAAPGTALAQAGVAYLKETSL